MYPWKYLAMDVGYRAMLNLNQLNDRNGFVIKMGTAYWPEKAPPPPNHPPTVSLSADKNMVYFGLRRCDCADRDGFRSGQRSAHLHVVQHLRPHRRRRAACSLAFGRHVRGNLHDDGKSGRRAAAAMPAPARTCMWK